MVVATAILVVCLTFDPSISNPKVSNWSNFIFPTKVEAMEESIERVAVLDGREGQKSFGFPYSNSKDYSLGITIPPGARQTIVSGLESLAKKPGLIRSLLSLLLPLINLVVGLLIFVFNVVLGFFNLISLILLPLWLYLVNLIRSRWEKVYMDLHVKAPIEDEAKGKLFRRKKENGNDNKILIKNYKGFLDKVPLQMYKEEACVVKIDLNCNSQSNRSKPKKAQSDPTISEILLEAFKPQINESSLSEEIQLDKKANYLLELELSSPEFKVLPDGKQSQALDLEKLSYRWNCKVANTGKHTLDLVFRLVDQSDPSKVQKVIEMERDVKVVQIFGLTKDQAENLAKSVAAVVVAYGFINGILRGLHAVF
jgi:hypothetical protein